VIAAIALGILALIHYAVFRVARRAGRTIGQLAWRAAQGATVSFVLSVLFYEKPKSFYTNFVIFPALALYIAGLLATVATLVLGITALRKRDDRKRALIAIATALIAATAAIGLIIWRAS
jgi:hypothetical protein